jgi:hypothetical protein
MQYLYNTPTNGIESVSDRIVVTTLYGTTLIHPLMWCHGVTIISRNAGIAIQLSCKGVGYTRGPIPRPGHPVFNTDRFSWSCFRFP